AHARHAQRRPRPDPHRPRRPYDGQRPGARAPRLRLLRSGLTVLPPGTDPARGRSPRRPDAGRTRRPEPIPPIRAERAEAAVRPFACTAGPACAPPPRARTSPEQCPSLTTVEGLTRLPTVRNVFNK